MEMISNGLEAFIKAMELTIDRNQVLKDEDDLDDQKVSMGHSDQFIWEKHIYPTNDMKTIKKKWKDFEDFLERSQRRKKNRMSLETEGLWWLAQLE